MPDLTVSGNEITDALRALGVQGDGLSADSSFGIWEATTNRALNSRGKTNTASWTEVGGLTTFTREADAQWGSRFKAVLGAATSNVMATAMSGGSKAAGAKWAGRYRIKGEGSSIGKTARLLWWESGGASGAQQAGIGSVVLTSAWQDLKDVIGTIVQADRTAISLYVQIVGGAIGDTVYFTHVQGEEQPLSTPVVETDGATATRAAARVQAPASLLDETQGWVAMRVRMGWGNTSEPGAGAGFIGFFEWRDDTSNKLSIYYAESTNQFAIERRVAGVQTSRAITQALVKDDMFTIVAAWTATQVRLSINGAAILETANANIPTLAATLFDIGSTANASHFDSDVLWFACGTDTLTDAQAASIHAFGNTDNGLEDFTRVAPASAVTASIPFATASYITEAFTIIDAGPTGASRGILPRLKVEIDFTNDPTNATRVWTDITTDVRAISYTRSGRNHELQRTESGSLQAVLNNRDGDYDPTNTTSPRYPGVKRKRWIRVSAAWDLTIHRRWTGLIDSWEQNWPVFGRDATVSINATSSLSVLNLFDLKGRSYPAQRTDERIAAVLTAVGVTDYTLETGKSTVVAAGPFADASMALPHLLEVEQTENGLLFAEGDGKVIFQNRHHRPLNPTVIATIGDAGVEIPYRTARLTLDEADLWNVVTVTPAGGTAETATDATSVTQHYERRLNLSSLSASQADALGAAQSYLRLYKDSPSRIPEVGLVGANTPTTWPTILAAGNSDRFTWKRRATANTISQDVLVERVFDSISPGQDWKVSFQLSPADSWAAWLAADPVYSLAGTTTFATY